jgi:hypothetical protein
MSIYNQLSRVPPSLFVELGEEPEVGTPSPLDGGAPEAIKIKCANNLDDRLRVLKRSQDGPNTSGVPEIHLEGTPEIRLQTEVDDVPEISLSSAQDAADTASPVPKVLHSKLLSTAGAHPRHTTSLIRLLFIHSSLHPASRAPHVASLLVPLYGALVQEIEPSELAHAEADTFWAFESFMAEFGDLQDEQEGSVWTLKFSQRLAWADDELFTNLNAKGLDPALPHYS